MPASEFSRALDAALQAGGLTLSEVQQRLSVQGHPVSIATLSYWRSGERHPDPVRSAAAVAALETILAVAPATLSARVTGHSRRLGAIGRVESTESAGPRRARMLRSLGITPPQNFRMLSIQETIDVGPDLAISTVETELLVQCVQGVLETLGFVNITPEPATAPPLMVARAGGTMTGPVTDDSGTVFGYRLTVERPLSAGETAMIQVRTSHPAGSPAVRNHLVVVQRRAREVLQWFRFTDGHTPDWFEEDEVAQRTRTTTISDPETVHRARVDFGPGQLLSRWGLIDDL